MHKFYPLILILIGIGGCAKKNHEEPIEDCIDEPAIALVKEDSSINVDSKKTNPFPWKGHQLEFTTHLKYSAQKIIIDTSTYHFPNPSQIAGFLINPSNKKVVRLFRYQESNQRVAPIDGYYVGKSKVTLPSPINQPIDFKGDFLFSNIWRGHELGGTITKVKYQLLDSGLQAVDTLKGGVYSEGAGTWEWVVGYQGEPIGIVYGGDQRFGLSPNMLVVTNWRDKTSFLDVIDYVKQDTLGSIPLPTRRDVYHIKSHRSKILISYSSEPLCTYLSMYDPLGELIWQQPAGYFRNIFCDSINNRIIAHGYHFIESSDKNANVSFIICFEASTGEVIWDFPTTEFFDKKYFVANELFAINSELYAVIFQQRTHQQETNHLIFFNSDGELITEFELDNGREKYSVISHDENEFELIYSAKSIHFKISKDHS